MGHGVNGGGYWHNFLAEGQAEGRGEEGVANGNAAPRGKKKNGVC